MLICVVLIGLGSIVYVCYAMSKSARPSDSVTFVFSGAELGCLKPCGCSEGQLGGIGRRDSFLQQLRGYENIIIPIANGNLIQDASPQSQIKVDIGFFALADMGYVAYNIGERDLQLGTVHLTTLSEQSGLPLVNANLYQGTSPAFTPYLLYKARLLSGNTVTIAIVGFISPQHAVYAKNADMQIIEPTVVLETLMPKLIGTADLVVGFLNGMPAEASALQADYPAIELMVVSSESTESVPTSEVPSLLVNTGVKGKAIHSVNVHRQRDGQLHIAESKRHLLDERVPDSQRMIELLTLYQHIIMDEDLTGSTPQQQKSSLKFVGTAACKTCHIDEWTSWKTTKHAHAYHTLEVAGHEEDPECLTCHTIGFGFSGFLSIEETPNYLDVGCENCHGAGSIHVKQQSEVSNAINIDYGTVTEATCLVCHTMKNSPKFDLKVYFPKILHTLEEYQ